MSNILHIVCMDTLNHLHTLECYEFDFIKEYRYINPHTIEKYINKNLEILKVKCKSILSWQLYELHK